MARATSPRGARRAVSSTWCSNPDTRGAYSYLRIGGRPAHRARLAERILPGCGSPARQPRSTHPATMHGAWFSGERAAAAVLDQSDGDVLVVGAGLAGFGGRPQHRRRRSQGDGARVDRSRRRSSHDRHQSRHPAASRWRVVARRCRPSAGWAGVLDTRRLGCRRQLRGRPRCHLRCPTAPGGGRCRAPHRATDRCRRRRHTAAEALESALGAQGEIDPIVRACVAAWFTVEIENLYAAPIDDFAPSIGYEPYELEGDDCLITSSLEPVIEQLANGSTSATGTRCRLATRDDEQGRPRWLTDSGHGAYAVIVTVPVARPDGGRIVFDPGSARRCRRRAPAHRHRTGRQAVRHVRHAVVADGQAADPHRRERPVATSGRHDSAHGRSDVVLVRHRRRGRRHRVDAGARAVPA